MPLKPGTIFSELRLQHGLDRPDDSPAVLASYKTILHGIAADASRGVEELEILEESERRLVVEEWNRTAVDFGRFSPYTG